jgi:hypothetical protein
VQYFGALRHHSAHLSRSAKNLLAKARTAGTMQRNTC